MLPKGVLSQAGARAWCLVLGSGFLPVPTASLGLWARGCVPQDGVSFMPPPEPFPPRAMPG